MSYTEFYCDPVNGNQMNGGSDSGTPSFTSTNGNWDGTSIFTPTDGSTPANGVTVGQFAAVFLDGASTPAFVARVTNVAAGVNGAITVSTTAKIGSVPTSGATGRTIRVGGAWKGPNAADNWPIGSVSNALTNSSANLPRVNLKNNSSYSVTAQVTQSQIGVTVQGYTAAPGDGGKATIDAGGSNTGIWGLTGARSVTADLIFTNNGTGAVNGCTCTGNFSLVLRCVANNIRASGFHANNTTGLIFAECEAYDCNKSNTASQGGFLISGATCIRCSSHDHSTGSNCHGFVGSTSGARLLHCVADTNAGDGFRVVSSSTQGEVTGSDFYNNAGAGILVTASTSISLYVENSNFIKNGSYGVSALTTAVVPVNVVNCGFGSGTQVNGSGATNGNSVNEINSVTYAADVTPWVDPANGDFRINLPAAKGTGRGAFTETAASYAGTIGYPDIGAAQHRDASGTPGAIITTPGVTCA